MTKKPATPKARKASTKARLRAVLPELPSREARSHALLIASEIGRKVLAAIERDSGQSAGGIKFGLDYFDSIGGYPGEVHLVWGDDGRPDHGESEVLDWGGPPEWALRVPDVLREQVEEALEYAADHMQMQKHVAKVNTEAKQWREARGLKPTGKAKRPAPKPLATTPEAVRKRMARAAGKVKPRAPRIKPARTPAQEVASRRKAVATREAQLHRLTSARAERSGAVSMWEMLRAEESLRRARKALQTFEERLAGSARPIG